MIPIEPSWESIRTICRIDFIVRDILDMDSLYRPLAMYLMPTWMHLNMLNAAKKDYVVDLSQKDWPDQYKATILKCVGLKIIWVV